MKAQTLRNVARYIRIAYHVAALFILVFASMFCWDFLCYGSKYSECILPVELVWFLLTSGSALYMIFKVSMQDTFKAAIALCTGIVLPLFILIFMLVTPASYAPAWLYHKTSIPRPTFHFSELPVK